MRKKHIAIGFYRTIGVGLATLIGAIVILILAIITGADISTMGLTIN